MTHPVDKFRTLVKVDGDEGSFILKDEVILEMSLGDLEYANKIIDAWMEEHPEYVFMQEYDIPNRRTIIRWKRVHHINRTKNDGYLIRSNQ